jgi:hypothetical protein
VDSLNVLFERAFDSAVNQVLTYNDILFLSNILDNFYFFMVILYLLLPSSIRQEFLGYNFLIINIHFSIHSVDRKYANLVLAKATYQLLPAVVAVE